MKDPFFRRKYIAVGDSCLNRARALALRDDITPGGFLPGEAPSEVYEWDLRQAEQCYRLAGLSVLAGRVRFFARRVALYGTSENVRESWETFDRLNASGRCPI
jgi:hypothetical protein